MQQVISTLEEMVEEGIISDFVIGGATALIYFSSPTFTEDIDVFIYLKEATGPIIDIGPVYSFLKEKKNATQGDEYIFLEGFPLQFLIPYDDLTREAFENPVKIELDSKSFKIFGLEYLMAIMIQLKKKKYIERLRILIEEDNFDKGKLTSILERFKLTQDWQVLQERLS